MSNWGRKWTTKETLLIKQWQEKGVPGKEQAKKLGRSHSSWKAAVFRYGLERHKHGERYSNYKPELRAATIDLLGRGYKLVQIAKTIGIGPSKISRIVQEFIDKDIVIRVRKGTYKITKEWR